MTPQSLELFALWHADNPEGLRLVAEWREALVQDEQYQERRKGDADRRKSRRPRRRRPRRPKGGGAPST